MTRIFFMLANSAPLAFNDWLWHHWPRFRLWWGDAPPRKP